MLIIYSYWSKAHLIYYIHSLYAHSSIKYYEKDWQTILKFVEAWKPCIQSVGDISQAVLCCNKRPDNFMYEDLFYPQQNVKEK